MFGDLDWSLNASRGLSAIAEFLVLYYDVEVHSADYAIAFYLRAVSREVLWSSARVCLSVCAPFFVRNISQERVHVSPTNLVGGSSGWTSRMSSILVLIGFRMRIQDHFSISVNLAG